MPVEHDTYRFGQFVLDVREHCLRTDGTLVHLPPKTFDTLLHLVRQPGHLVTKQELLGAVWPGVSVTENVLTRCIKEIRDALADEAHAPLFIETVPRLGYRFIAPVETTPAASPDAGGPWPEARAPRRRWYRHPVFWLAAVLFMLLGLAQTISPGAPPALPFEQRDFVLVTDFDNRTGERVLDETLGPAFVVSLDQSTHVNVLPRARAREALQRMGQPADRRIDDEVGREICLREHVRGLVALSVTKAGSRYAVTARLIDPVTGEAVRSRVESASGPDRLLPALRLLSARVSRDLGESLSSIRRSDQPLLRVTTPSLKALQCYSDGVALWQKGEYGAAVQLHQAAIREDPDFAMAHAAVGSAYFTHVYVLDPARGKEHYERALRASHRTTERERLSIRMQYEADLGRRDAAADLFTAYLRSYPDDFRARYTFATFLMRNDRSAEAFPHLLEVVRTSPNYTAAYINLATSYANLGKYREALDAYAKAFTLEPAWLTRGNLNHEYGFLLLRAGDAARAREVFEKAAATDASKAGGLRSLALLDLYEGKYASARDRLDQAVQLSASKKFFLNESRNSLFLAIALDGQGRRAASLAALDRATRMAAQANAGVWLRSRIAVAYARHGSARAAGDLVDGMRGNVDPQSAEQRSDLHRAEGETLLAQRQPDRALAALTLADNERRSPFTVESLARAARLRGDLEAAIRHYRGLLDMKDGSLGFEPQQDWLGARYWLARAYFSRGEANSARETLAPLLETWRDGDADLPLLHDARQLASRLATTSR